MNSDKPRRQHYVSAMLLKQWGDTDEGRDTKIAYYDMYRRTHRDHDGSRRMRGTRHDIHR